MGFYDRPNQDKGSDNWLLFVLLIIFVVADGVARPQNNWTRVISFLLTLALGVGITLAYQHFFGAPPTKVKT